MDVLAMHHAAATRLPTSTQSPQAVREVFGKMPDGTPVEAVVLSNSRGVAARIITLGASLQSLIAPARDGRPANIALGFATPNGYLANEYFGSTLGRYANRIANGRFVLDGRTIELPINDGPNSLHGGTRGFDKALWKIVSLKRTNHASGVRMSYVSPDGEMGYPGTLAVLATYTLDENNSLSIEYVATTNKPTIVNLSNHAYWNLSGESSGCVTDHWLQIAANAYLPVDDVSIPTGEFRSVLGTPFDFRKAKPIGRDIRCGNDAQLLNGHGYDHNFVIARDVATLPRRVARIEDFVSGRVLVLHSTQPGLQFYSANYFCATAVGTGGRIYRQGDAFALEPQLFPDTPNRPAFGSARLEPGQPYRNLIVYEFLTATGPDPGCAIVKHVSAERERL
jgi:aldose 1-epimerase